jgi:hypothetical protein
MSSVTPLAAALIGAGGVVFGGVLTTSGQLLIERGRAKRERQAEERRHARELRLAVRLVMEELAEALSLVEAAARSGRYWVGPRQLPTDTWNRYRTDIAAAIEASLDWRRITAAYDAINNLNWVVGHRRHTSRDVSGHTEGFRTDPQDQLRDVWMSLRLAIETLEATLSITGEASRVVGEREALARQLWPHGDGEDFDIDSARIADRQERAERERGDH